MLDSLITSKTRIKLLIRLFLNPDTKGYLRGLAEEFKESTNAVRIELNRLEDAGMLNSRSSGNKKVYSANTKHPLFPEVQNILRKVTGIDDIINRVAQGLGGIEAVFLTGDLAEGMDSKLIDLIIVGDSIDQEYLSMIVVKAEKFANRKIRSLCLQPQELDNWKQSWTQKLLLLWSTDRTK